MALFPEEREILVQTTCKGCLNENELHERNETCKKFRRAKLEKEGRERRRTEAKEKEEKDEDDNQTLPSSQPDGMRT